MIKKCFNETLLLSSLLIFCLLKVYSCLCKILSSLNRDSRLGFFYKTSDSQNSQENCTCTALFFNIHSFIYKNNFIRTKALKLRTSKRALFDITSTWNSNSNLKNVFSEYVTRFDFAEETFILFHLLPQWILSYNVFNIKFYTILCPLIKRFQTSIFLFIVLKLNDYGVQ